MPINQIRSCKNQMLTPKQIAVRIAWESNSNLITKKVCKWMKKNDKFPSQGSKNSEEKQMATWLVHRKKAKQGKGRFVHYESSQRIAESHEHPNLFEAVNRESDSNEMTRKICEWIKGHNGYKPRASSQDEQESKLGKWLSNRKKKND